MMENVKKFKVPILIFLIFVILALLNPTIASRSTQVTWDYFKEMALILPPVFLLMGLMEVWVPKDKIQKWIGSGSGIKGGLISLILGTLPTGPLYVAFPMTATLVRKGASITNMVIFLGSWAALKIPQLMVEVKFLGVSFTGLRFVLTLIALVIMGLIMETVLGRHVGMDWLPPESNETMKKKGY
ncbi:MAG: permease [Tissierellales bacterium]|nr:permease [Tissierellales bacterium]MBN2828009.1 permease [Tissierellales bacterium]